MEVTSIFQLSRLFPSLRFSLHAAYFTNFITTICALLHHGNAKHHEFAKDSMPLQNITWSEAESKNAHFKGVAVIFQIDDPFERSNIRPFSKKNVFIYLCTDLIYFYVFVLYIDFFLLPLFATSLAHSIIDSCVFCFFNFFLKSVLFQNEFRSLPEEMFKTVLPELALITCISAFDKFLHTYRLRHIS